MRQTGETIRGIIIVVKVVRVIREREREIRSRAISLGEGGMAVMDKRNRIIGTGVEGELGVGRKSAATPYTNTNCPPFLHIGHACPSCCPADSRRTHLP